MSCGPSGTLAAGAVGAVTDGSLQAMAVAAGTTARISFAIRMDALPWGRRGRRGRQRRRDMYGTGPAVRQPLIDLPARQVEDDVTRRGDRHGASPSDRAFRQPLPADNAP